jgi:hypothetical protein
MSQELVHTVTTMIQMVYCCISVTYRLPTLIDLAIPFVTTRLIIVFQHGFSTNCSATCLQGMIRSQFLWYFCPLTNVTHFLKRDDSLDLKRVPREHVGRLHDTPLPLYHHMQAGFPFVCTL